MTVILCAIAPNGSTRSKMDKAARYTIVYLLGMCSVRSTPCNGSDLKAGVLQCCKDTLCHLLCLLKIFERRTLDFPHFGQLIDNHRDRSPRRRSADALNITADLLSLRPVARSCQVVFRTWNTRSVYYGGVTSSRATSRVPLQNSTGLTETRRRAFSIASASSAQIKGSYPIKCPSCATVYALYSVNPKSPAD